MTSALAGKWNAFWFRPIPPQVFAALRVCFGVLGLADLLGTLPISMYWDLDGLIPLPGGGSGTRTWLLASGWGPIVARLVFAGTALSFVGMILGIKAQLAVIAALLASVFQAHWNSLPLSAAHQVLTVVLFTLVWADCGQMLLFGGRRGTAPGPEPLQPIWPLRLLQVQVCFIYLNSGLWKLYGAVWRDGTAVHYVLSTNMFQRVALDVPPGLTWFTALGTYGTLLWEIAFAFLVLWRPTRLLALAAGVMFHLGVWATLEVGPFSWMMLATYLAFLDQAGVAAVVDRIRGVRSTPTPRTAPPT